MSKTRYLLLSTLALFALVILGALMLLIRQGNDHDRTLMDYRASRVLTELAEEGLPEGGLPAEVVGLGLYRIDGVALESYGSAPSALVTTLAGRVPGGAVREWSELTGGVVRLIRESGSRGALGRGTNGRTGGADIALPGRVFWLIDYDVNAILRERRVRVTAVVALLLLLSLLALLTAQLARRLRRAEANARQNESLAQLGAAARTITHEIKNPLAAIRLQTALIRRLSPAEADLIAPLATIEEEVARLSELAEGVRTFLGDPRGTPERLPLAPTVREITERLPFPVKIGFSEAGASAVIMIDRLRLESVIFNLCNNAQQASEAAGSPELVEVHGTRTGATVCLTVADRGAGVPAELRQQIFEPFFTTRERGSGVGLAAVRTFVNAAGGTVEIADRPGGGAQFVVKLPVEGETQ